MLIWAVSVFHQTNAAAWEHLVAGGLAAFFMLAGVGFGLVVLFGGRRHGAKSLLGLAVASIVLGLCLLRLANKRYQAIAGSPRHAVLIESADAQPVPASQSTDRPTPVQLRSQRAVDSTENDKQLLAQASASYLAKLQALTADYDRSYRILEQANVLDFQNLRTRAELVSRRRAVESFLAANESWREAIANAEQLYQIELRNVNLAPGLAEQALGEFRSGTGEQSMLLLQMRGADTQWGNAILAMLDLLGSNWGQWSYDQAESSVSFQDDDMTTRYDRLVDAMNAAEDEHAAAAQANARANDNPGSGRSPARLRKNCNFRFPGSDCFHDSAAGAVRL